MLASNSYAMLYLYCKKLYIGNLYAFNKNRLPIFMDPMDFYIYESTAEEISGYLRLCDLNWDLFRPTNTENR